MCSFSAFFIRMTPRPRTTTVPITTKTSCVILTGTPGVHTNSTQVPMAMISAILMSRVDSHLGPGNT